MKRVVKLRDNINKPPYIVGDMHSTRNWTTTLTVYMGAIDIKLSVDLGDKPLAAENTLRYIVRQICCESL